METVARVAAVYFFLMVMFRVIGKRDIGQLAPFDLVILLLIPELVAQSLVGQDESLTNGFIGVSTLLGLVYVTSMVSHRSRRISTFIEGQPTVLVHHGTPITEALNRERVTSDELVAQMRHAGIGDIAEVEWAILETDGGISFVPLERSRVNQAEGKKVVG